MKHLLSAVFILLATPFFLNAQSLSLTGLVTDTQNIPLAGATVALTSKPGIFTRTDTAGRFLFNVPTTAKSITVTMSGYRQQIISLGRRAALWVRLEPEWHDLGEVVVVGFGTQSRRRITGAVSSAKAEVFENVSVPVFQRALQGQLPGVVVTNASGGLDAESIIRIRGVSSIGAGNQPLIVVDGLALSDRPGSWTMGYTTNPFIGLNPNDIASVDVLKDAAATAIYGSRGSNGVILLTTKNGAYNQRPKVSTGYYAGFSEISKRYELLDGPEYAALFNTAVINAGANLDWLYKTAQPSTDWQDLLLRKGFVSETNASVSGGTAANKYYIGATYRDEDSYLRTIGLKRYSLRANFEQRLSETIALGLAFNPSRVVDQRAGNQFIGSAHGWSTFFPPNVEAYDANGVLRRDEILTSNGWEWGTANPGVVLEDQWILTTTSKMLTNTYLDWRCWKNLRFRTEFGVEFNQEQESRKFGKATFFGAPAGWASELNQQLFNYNWTNQLVWNALSAGNHILDATLGLHLTKENFHGAYADAGGFAADRLTSLGDAARFEYADTWTTGSAFAGYFARINYTWRNKYLLDLSARYDGSSRFGKSNRYGFFPAFSAGWVFTNESFFPKKLVEFLKLRSSLGLTGNAGIADFAYLSSTSFEPKYADQPGFILQSIADQDLSWETNLQWNAGLDFSWLSGRLSGSVDYFIKNTRDLLLQVPVPATNGVSFITQNTGSLRNSGLEFFLSAELLRGAFQWTFQLNGATLKNKIIRLSDNDGDGVDDDFVTNQRMLYRVGQSIGSFYLVEYAGVDPVNGNALFYDLAGNRLANDASPAYRKIAGTAIPRFTGGFTNTFRFRQFDLSTFFTFKTGHKIYLEQNQLYIEQNMSNGVNQLKTQLYAWTPSNPNTDVPEARLSGNNGNQPSTRYLKPADYLRLNHLVLGYTLEKPSRWKVRIHVFVAAQNLLTFTAFTGLDPDAEFYPAGDSGQGAVRYNLPAARTYTAGVSMGWE